MILDFLENVVNLKKISRQGWIDKISHDKPESVAEHCFSMSVMGMLFSDLENYDSEKILRMVLLHDLAESKIGDLTPEQIDRAKKLQLEDNAFKKIIESLPDSIKSQYKTLWEEYIENNSQEAQFVHQIDKLEMALQAKIYEKDGYPTEKLKSFFDSANKEITNTRLKEVFRKIIDDY